MASLTIDGLAKQFVDRQVLAGINLCVSSGELLAVLGASGCGKTTLLRLIAGFEQADAERPTILTAQLRIGAPFNLPSDAVTQVASAICHRSCEPGTTRASKRPRSITVLRSCSRVCQGPSVFAAHLPSPRLSGCDMVKPMHALQSG